jgi:hypothetical protein
MKLQQYSLILITLFLTSCATIVTNTVEQKDLDKAPDGIRVYAPKLYLFVDATKHTSTIVNLPDYKRAYDIKPLTVFAKNDFNIKMEVGQVSDLTSNQDTTAFLEFIKGAAQMAVKAGGLPAALSTVDGDFGFKSGVYTLSDDGKWVSAK